MFRCALVLGLLAGGVTSALAAGSEDEYKAAYAAAEAANKEAGKLRNQWTTTASTLAPSTSTTATLAPSRAKRIAPARPMPEPAAVTMPILPSSRIVSLPCWD